MSPNLADLGRRFRFNENLLGLVTQHLVEDDWKTRPPGGGNTPHWILGHVTATRRFLLRTIGTDVEELPWEGLFSMRVKPASTDTYPAPSELLASFKESGERLERSLAGLSAEDAAQPWGGELPDGSKDRAGAAGFLYMHEVYHLGQIGLLNRICGHPGFA